MFRRRINYTYVRKRARQLARLSGGAAPEGSPSWRDCMRRGASLMSAGDAKAAARYYRRAAGLQPGCVLTLTQLGSALLRAGKPRHALRRFNAALSFDAGAHRALHGKGLACAQLADRDQALGAFRRAVQIDPEAWRSWQSIADLTPEEDERLSAIDAGVDALVRAAAAPSAGPEIVHACATELMEAGRADEAIRFVERNFDRFRDAETASARLARAYYRSGAFEAAFLHETDALKALAGAASPSRPATAARFDPAAARSALQDILSILDAAGLQAFLAAGTLLGFIRDGGPLPHDRDVDIGVLRGPDGGPDIAALIRTHPELMLKRGARPGERYYALLHRGVGIDIFLHDVRRGHFICGVSDWPGDVQWRFTAFDIKETAYGDLRCRIPSDPERYLEETYGARWRRPDRTFASAISSPALFKVSSYARGFYSAARARRALFAGDPAKAVALIAQSPVPIEADVSTNGRHAPDPSTSSV